jgi:ketosteroid isomerase-like protein
MPIVTQTRVHEIYEHLALARIDRLADAFDDRVDFLSHAPAEVFPFLGRHRGRAEVIAALSEMHRSVEIFSFRPLTVLIDGNKAALSVFINLRDRSTGKTAAFLAAHFLRFRAGRVVEFCGIIDSLAALRQLTEAPTQEDVKEAIDES